MNWRNRIFKIKISTAITPQLVEKIADKLDDWTIYKPEFIALIINSVGGSLIQTQTLATILKKYSKQKKIPIYCFGEDVVIKSALGLLTIGDKVFTNQYSIVGNIGYSQIVTDIRKFTDKWMLNQQLVTSNENMKLFNPFQELKFSDQQWIENILKQKEENLIEMIESNRKMDQNTLQNRINEIYRNGIITPQILLKHGIIDGYTNFDTLVSEKKIRKII